MLALYQACRALDRCFEHDLNLSLIQLVRLKHPFLALILIVFRMG